MIEVVSSASLLSRNSVAGFLYFMKVTHMRPSFFRSCAVALALIVLLCQLAVVLIMIFR
jgi:hypothetical protein